MKLEQLVLSVRTKAKSFSDISPLVNKKVSALDIKSGICNLFVQHTSCSLIISENCDPDVLLDLETFMSSLVSEESNYLHSAEGKDDMPAHIRSALTQTHLTVPISDGKLSLGTWQAIYLWEHRGHAHDRKIVLSVLES